MKIVIVGGGKVGYYLVKTLLSFRHQVLLIEMKKERCEDISDELNLPVYHGDATKINILRDADAYDADVFIAVTGLDEENLVACQLAKNNLHAKKTIARVNNPKNAKVFQRLGVDMTLNSTSIIADLIEEAVDYEGMKTLTSLKNNRVIVSEVLLKENSPALGRRIDELRMPKDCVLVSVLRNDEMHGPEDDLILDSGDSVIMVSNLENKKRLHKIFISC